MEDNSNRYLGRHICTADEPYSAPRHGTHAAHPDSKYVGGCSSGCCDYRECPHCGTRFTVEHPD